MVASSSRAGYHDREAQRGAAGRRCARLCRGAEQPQQVAVDHRERRHRRAVTRTPRSRLCIAPLVLPAVPLARRGCRRRAPRAAAERRIGVQRADARARSCTSPDSKSANASSPKYASTARVRDTIAGRPMATKSNILLQWVSSRKRSRRIATTPASAAAIAATSCSIGAQPWLIHSDPLRPSSPAGSRSSSRVRAVARILDAPARRLVAQQRGGANQRVVPVAGSIAPWQMR